VANGSLSAHGGHAAVKSNVKEFVRGLDVASKLYHRELMETLCMKLNDIRQDVAEKEIIPRTVPWNYGVNNLKRLYKMQRSTPGRVTTRTGMLSKVFSRGGYGVKGDWNIPASGGAARMAGSTSKHLYFRVLPQKQGDRIFYIAEGRVRASGENPTKEMQQRINQELRHGRMYLAPAVRKISDTQIKPEIMRLLVEQMRA
jgi:hypothetical protein